MASRVETWLFEAGKQCRYALPTLPARAFRVSCASYRTVMLVPTAATFCRELLMLVHQCCVCIACSLQLLWDILVRSKIHAAIDVIQGSAPCQPGGARLTTAAMTAGVGKRLWLSRGPTWFQLLKYRVHSACVMCVIYCRLVKAQGSIRWYA